MKISYLGHSCFQIKTSLGTVVMDPYADPNVGEVLKKVTGDIVTISHTHDDHNAISKVQPSTKREKSFVIDAPGEYEVGGISIFGIPSFHDAEQGAQRGTNIIFTVQAEDLVISHLGDLGHLLTEEQVSALGAVDVLLCPVGGVFTIDPKQALATIKQINPSYVIPMHFKTDSSKGEYEQLAPLADFLKLYGLSKEPVTEFSISVGSLPEETELVVMSSSKE
ncbi:MAG: Zn-dependent hydrolase of the beta-lactamase fold-like protein [Microgenomates group bacterium GW2011_GWF2_45_18]|nr:MAG: Zn-dependent hydrolase of the beta-lactamase fold-like protein [Microgenomates group bacterium GW2011_GWF1_44_10]KKU01804.1 MAG: Zn-dependent hydrolase of the beta-lactamase fold-like protein [Microgenomates group bacterium GW2011_GWF2_45_18]OGJ41279.1 MAG: hypothetical protein A2378_04285 [Candidatus Pacebacteria bacterium RIFOXYB1_FULL_44_10]HAU98892.1 hypothetical protein [Candidatus Paceibacterota bacterium]HAX01151.1 hypothetical protein [Candidatus Paceibacterota bacterium]